MDCREAQENLEIYARGELEAPLALDMAAHLKSCAKCRALHDDVFAVRVTLREYAENTSLAASPDFNRRAMEKFAALQTQTETPKNTVTYKPAARQNPQAPLPRGLGVLTRMWSPLALACIALLIYFAPPLRTAWQAQTAAGLLPSLAEDETARYERQEQQLRQLNKVIARHPENYRWKVAAGFYHLYSVPGIPPTLPSFQPIQQALKDVLPLHPHDPWILSLKLRSEMSVGGLMFGVSGNSIKAKEMLLLAKRGAVLEPENAFWKQVEAFWHLEAGDSAGAQRAVSEALRKKHYDDHALEDVRQAYALRSALHPLLPEEKVVLWPTIVGQLNEIQFNAAEMLNGAVRAEKRGDHARALNLYNDALRLQMISPLGASSARSYVEDIFARGAVPDARNSAALGSDFVAYAKRHGRPDVAENALRTLSFANQQDIAQQKVFVTDEMPGVRRADTATLALQNVVQPSLRNLLQYGVLLWLALGALILTVPHAAMRMQRRLPAILTRPRGVLPLPSRRAVFGAVALCVLAAIPAIVLNIVLPAQDYYLENGALPTFYSATDWLSSFNSDGNIDVSSLTATLQWLFPTAVLFWAMLTGASLAVRSQERAAEREPRSLKSIFAGSDFAALFPPIANWTLNLATLLVWAAFPAWWDAGSLTWVFGVAMLCAFLCAMRIAVRWWRLPQRRAAIGLAFVTLHRVLGASVVAGALLWVVLQLAMQPPRQRIDEAIATLLRDGETQVILRRAAEIDARKS